MISVTQAKRILSAHAEKGEKQTMALRKSLDSIVAATIYSPIAVPSFDNSSMDGYAMAFEEEVQQYQVVAVIQAGDTSEQTLKRGQAARIFTGAKIPAGADTVIQQELVDFDEATGKITYLQDKIKTGSNVRKKGSQCESGSLILEKGSRITPGVIGLLASVGLAEVEVYARPKVGYIITGNELKEVGTALREGEIFNSNGPMLEALLEKTGIREISAYKALDDKNELQQTIKEALKEQDVLMLSGGISVGDYDFVKECLEAAGVEELFYKIKQRPGKPMYAGKKGQKWVFALPGNPASVLNCFVQYVRPCLKYMMGHEEVWKPDRKLPLSADFKKLPPLTFFVKARAGKQEVEILTGQQSFNLQSFNLANCLAELEEEEKEFSEGTLVNIFQI